MKERPILFSGEMVRAILAGRKTVTRRVVEPQPPERWDRVEEVNGSNGAGLIAWDFYNSKDRLDHGYLRGLCPYGQTGDRLWVRESFAVYESFRLEDGWVEDIVSGRLPKTKKPSFESVYRADHDLRPGNIRPDTKWRPSIHMPRWASRITLEVTGVRVERVQDITETDAAREGFTGPEWTHRASCSAAFSDYWDDLNQERGFGWDKNPWVWVIEFKKSTPPLLAGEGKEKEGV